LLGNKIGIGQTHLSGDIALGPKLTRPPNMGGNGPTGTEDSFDIYSHFGTHLGTYWFGGYPANPYAGFRFELFGASDPATGTTYAGIGLQGNDAALYTLGEWSDGGTIHFLHRKNGMVQNSWIVANTVKYSPPWYLPFFDVTLVPRIPFPALFHMSTDPVGDFDRFDFTVGAAGANLRIYMQGAITDYFTGGPVAPIDLSNAVVSN